jgi:hypothetical protein
MPKLNQINALVTGRKSDVEKGVTEIYKILQKPELFTGREGVYRPDDEVNGEKLPREHQKVQHTVAQLLVTAKEKWCELWDLTATQDHANQQARANIEVDGKVVLADVPVTTLLFLEKQINDVETMIGKVPTPDQSEDWQYDSNAGLLRSEVSKSARTKKEPAHYVKYEATKDHPAQVEYFMRDVKVGTWDKTAFSGAMPTDTKNAILARLKKLKDAVKLARESANMLDAKPQKIGAAVFEYIIQGGIK